MDLASAHTCRKNSSFSTVGRCRQFEVYKQAAELAQTMLGVAIGSSQIDRLTSHYGAAIDPDLDQPAPLSPPPVDPPGVVYAQADGAMLLTDEGYKEAKLGRIFLATALKASVVEERGGHVESSTFVGHVGTELATFDWRLFLGRFGDKLQFNHG